MCFRLPDWPAPFSAVGGPVSVPPGANKAVFAVGSLLSVLPTALKQDAQP